MSTTPTPTSILLGLLADLPDGAPPLAGRDVRGEPRLLIDGRLVQAERGATFPVTDPSTGREIGDAADASPADMDRAIGAARDALDDTSWSRDPALRARCLRQMQRAMREDAEILRRDLVAEIGCAVRMTYGDQLDRPIEKLGFYADLAERYAYRTRLGGGEEPLGNWFLRTPVGVVGAITPWNIPVELSLAKVGAALAAGCTAILKPSPLSPWSATHLGRLVAERTEMPPGVFNVVSSSSSEVAALLTTDPRVDAVAFTGSTATGKAVMAAAAGTVKRVLLELGGKSANVILDDADLEAIVPLAAAFVCFNAGQSCILPSRLLVPRSRYEECVELATEGVRQVPYGDPTDPDVFMGPLISAEQRARVEGFVAVGEAEGARLTTGGRPATDRGDGFFFEPTVFADVDPLGTLAQEEVFGPVLAVIPHDGDDDAVRLANATVYGLAGYVWGGDTERAVGVAERLRCGMVAVNGGSFIGAELPFGGVRQSGVGREWGVAGFEEFLELQSIGVGGIGT
ncbi:MAG TPA: aldehyde dehydrogenase family protein [Gaiellaceae bacterium]|nr:aldehyde dehydrogenase family protein [Gaiellaceae bacterium]